MHFNPRNRHLYIEIINQREPGDESQILLPEDYRPNKDVFVRARLLDWAADCNGAYLEEDIIVVKQNMIEEIKVGKEVFHLVLENYVMGILEEDDLEVN